MKALQSLFSKLQKDNFIDYKDISFENNEICLTILPGKLRKLLNRLKTVKSYSLDMLIDICGVDYPDNSECRFFVIYHLLSMKNNTRVRIKVMSIDGVIVPTISDIFSSATWYEREVWDMYGILFSGNKDLRRILTDYGFSGHPLRKDFPLTGNVQLSYEETLEKTVYREVSLKQEYREFNFISPWEGNDSILPGDEKKSE